MARWTRAGFADANTYASHEQHPKITGQAAEGGHRTPYHHRDRQNFDAAAPVGQRRDGYA